MTFTTLALTGDRVLVRGTDSTGTSGETVLHSEEWNQVKAQRSHAQAHDEFDSAVDAFFAPLLEAAEALEVQFTQPEVDPIGFVTIREGEQHVHGEQPVVVQLHHDSIVLRLIEEGKDDRLVWVNERLEVLAPKAQAPAVTDTPLPEPELVDFKLDEG